ncbi:hypothetical protein [Ancylobacter mangrovi]|uniref:Uncharacterized protein n=1 Tax=Ancylobacter mangrovi TaxID=2972472 RepID=A0A9X2P713_9HYPH|nr:hypothetical protein [Ancylobacter mangrovi]MCS0493467.1 hypothetical protein [Ancylobacter mangrovi]MCS0501915.1 hypothetical protein [Ancylobacter mangrovi]
MQRTEQTAREICLLDLKAKGFDDQEASDLVDRFWPVLANEIREGIIDGAWPFSAKEIEVLSEEYRNLLER